ncbi:MAG: ribosome-binding factor A [Patescibacteria group bacterium]|nr:ribosome-binding factor A [Patescibacteria group bacterium]
MHQERKKREVIKKISFILKEIIDNPKIFLTVLDIILPSKKGIMVIYLSIFPDEKKNEVIKILLKESNKIKQLIKKQKFLRYLPKKIFFKYDSGLKSMEEIDKILKSIK